MTFSDPKKFGEHLKKSVNDIIFKQVASTLEAKAKEYDGPATIVLTDVEPPMQREVKAELRRRGWTVTDDIGAKFTMRR